jgi:acyl carrier protein
MNLQRQIAKWLVETCLENGLFGPRPDRLNIDEIENLDLRDNVWFDSMSLVYLQTEIEMEWGVHIPISQFAAWLRTLKQVADYIADRLPAPGAPLAHAVADRRGCHDEENLQARRTVIQGGDGICTG